MWKTREDYEKMRDSILWVESQFIKIKKRIKDAIKNCKNKQRGKITK